MQKSASEVLRSILVLALLFLSQPLRAQSTQPQDQLTQQRQLVDTIQQYWYDANAAAPKAATRDELQQQFAALEPAQQAYLLQALQFYQQLQRAQFSQSLPTHAAPHTVAWLRGYNGLLNEIETEQVQSQLAALGGLSQSGVPRVNQAGISANIIVPHTALASGFVTYLATLETKSRRAYNQAAVIMRDMEQVPLPMQSFGSRIAAYAQSHQAGYELLTARVQQQLRNFNPLQITAMYELSSQLNKVQHTLLPILREIIANGQRQLQKGTAVNEVIDLMSGEIGRWQKAYPELGKWLGHYQGELAKLRQLPLNALTLHAELDAIALSTAAAFEPRLQAIETLDRMRLLMQYPHNAKLSGVLDVVFAPGGIKQQFKSLLTLPQYDASLKYLPALQEPALLDQSMWHQLQQEGLHPVGRSSYYVTVAAALCWIATAVVIVKAISDHDEQVGALDNEMRQSYQKLAQLPESTIDAAQVQQKLVEAAQLTGQPLDLPQPFDAITLLQEILQ